MCGSSRVLRLPLGIVGKELVSAAISAAELNSGGEARPAVSGPRPALESAREHPTSSATAAGSAEVIQFMCRSVTCLP